MEIKITNDKEQEDFIRSIEELINEVSKLSIEIELPLKLKRSVFKTNNALLAFIDNKNHEESMAKELHRLLQRAYCL